MTATDLYQAGYRAGHLANTRDREYRPADPAEPARLFRSGYLAGWLAVQYERGQPDHDVIWGPFDSRQDADQETG